MAMFGLVLTLLSSIVSWFLGKMRNQDIERGKQLQQAADIIANKEIEQQQNQILINEVTKEQVVEKMKKGTF